jgi:hypothetical protein
MAFAGSTTRACAGAARFPGRYAGCCSASPTRRTPGRRRPGCSGPLVPPAHPAGPVRPARPAVRLGAAGRRRHAGAGERGRDRTDQRGPADGRDGMVRRLRGPGAGRASAVAGEDRVRRSERRRTRWRRRSGAGTRSPGARGPRPVRPGLARRPRPARRAGRARRARRRPRPAWWRHRTGSIPTGACGGRWSAAGCCSTCADRCRRAGRPGLARARRTGLRGGGAPGPRRSCRPSAAQRPSRSRCCR